MTNPINRIFYDGIILDLDGVVTSTVLQHIKAWKESLDSFLLHYSRTHDSRFIPLDTDHDYKTYIDGKPRYSGVKSFLDSRNISLPYGKPDDLPGFDTICALGNLKNRIYLDLLNKEGAEVYEDALKMIKLWRSERLKTAIVSASKNCRQVLSSVGITDLFDLVFDGNDAEKNNLPGKPAPDIFLKACMLLNISNTRAVLFEDSESGIKAGKKGNFPLVVGVNRNGSGSLLYESGADLVLSKLTDLIVQPVPKKSSLLPSALSQLKEILSCVLHYKSIIFLDYDGTLTPIVSRPELAIMGESIRKALVELSDKIPVAIISGRELNDVRNLVQIPHIYYAGNHGFELRHPDGTETVLEDVKKYPPLLDRIETSLQPLRTSYPGVIIERKRFSLAVHYRLLKDESLIPPLETSLSGTVTQFSQYKLTSGKKVFELRPSIDWHKGKAVQVITNEIYGNTADSYPVYIGDDLTDEDAFRAIKGWGAGILVGVEGQPTLADYSLKDTTEVGEFIERLNRKL
jgi:alpha,alpha-trehalase